MMAPVGNVPAVRDLFPGPKLRVIMILGLKFEDNYVRTFPLNGNQDIYVRPTYTARDWFEQGTASNSFKDLSQHSRILPF